MRSKAKKHSGWVTPSSTIKNVKKKEIIDECLEPKKYYSDWDDYRDGFRDRLSDFTKLKKKEIEHLWSKIKKNNIKLKKLLSIRKIRKKFKK